MISEEQKIKDELNKKKINKKYKNYILKYIELNNEIFPFLDINEITERILKNFNKVSLNITSFIYNDYGQYNPTTGKILLSPKLFYGKNKKYKESVFLHELDHCACTPIEVKQKYNEYKNKINKILNKFIPDFILSENFLKIHYDGPISGIANLERKKGYTIQKITYGTNIQNYLNEGITYLKQKIYSEKLDIKFHKNKDYLYGARRAAECIGDVVGLEYMIYNHFYNNFDNIENAFFERTNIKIEELIFKCISYDKRNSKKKLKQLNDFIQEININRL